jgi:hypothetical protein
MDTNTYRYLPGYRRRRKGAKKVAQRELRSGGRSVGAQEAQPGAAELRCGPPGLAGGLLERHYDRQAAIAPSWRETRRA